MNNDACGRILLQFRFCFMMIIDFLCLRLVNNLVKTHFSVYVSIIMRVKFQFNIIKKPQYDNNDNTKQFKFPIHFRIIPHNSLSLLFSRKLKIHRINISSLPTTTLLTPQSTHYETHSHSPTR